MNAPSTTEEISEYLREHLSIEIDTGWADGEGDTVSVKLMLDCEVIADDYCTINNSSD